MRQQQAEVLQRPEQSRRFGEDLGNIQVAPTGGVAQLKTQVQKQKGT
jgi:hypothetical protein